MTGIIKILLRMGVVSAVVAGGTVLVAGPERVGAMFDQARTSLASAIDDNIDDPVALRRQLRELAEQYPERISQVRGDLAELNEHIRGLERDKAIAERVVELAVNDIATIDTRLSSLDRPENGSAVLASSDSSQVSRLSVQLSQIHQTRDAYQAQALDADRDLGYLRQQSQRLEDLLVQLETERAQFQAQISQIDREIDAVARNDRLIDLMEKRQQTIEECSRYKAVSLDQLKGRLGELRARQEAELQVLAETRKQLSYEDKARLDVDMELAQRSLPAEWPAVEGGARLR